jgi:uncharacterized membrane protein YfcA
MNAQQVWQSQATDAPRISLAYVRHGASALERRTRRRNALEYGVGIFCLAFIGFAIWVNDMPPPLMLAGMVWFVIWTLYYMYRWHRYAAAESSPADAGVLDTLRYQRRQFERQRDLRRGSWRWWGPPMIPGLALMLASLYFEIDPVPWKALGFMGAWIFVGSGLAAWLLEFEARRFQREIDALDSLAEHQ